MREADGGHLHGHLLEGRLRIALVHRRRVAALGVAARAIGLGLLLTAVHRIVGVHRLARLGRLLRLGGGRGLRRRIGLLGRDGRLRVGRLRAIGDDEPHGGTSRNHLAGSGRGADDIAFSHGVAVLVLRSLVGNSEAHLLDLLHGSVHRHAGKIGHGELRRTVGDLQNVDCRARGHLSTGRRGLADDAAPLHRVVEGMGRLAVGELEALLLQHLARLVGRKTGNVGNLDIGHRLGRLLLLALRRLGNRRIGNRRLIGPGSITVGCRTARLVGGGPVPRSSRIGGVGAGRIVSFDVVVGARSLGLGSLFGRRLLGLGFLLRLGFGLLGGLAFRFSLRLGLGGSLLSGLALGLAGRLGLRLGLGLCHGGEVVLQVLAQIVDIHIGDLAVGPRLVQRRLLGELAALDPLDGLLGTIGDGKATVLVLALVAAIVGITGIVCRGNAAHRGNDQGSSRQKRDCVLR